MPLLGNLQISCCYRWWGSAESVNGETVKIPKTEFNIQVHSFMCCEYRQKIM